MSVITKFKHRSLANMRLPLFVSPMFLVSGTELVIAASKSGVLGSFPAANARTTEQLETWLEQISREVDLSVDGPWAINLVANKLNTRFASDLALTCQYQAPVVITALGHPGPVVEAVHAYGGLVFADVISVEQARKAVNAGVDGLILVGAGAGGHTGSIGGFAFTSAVRQFWDGLLVVAGGIANGAGILACQALGADAAYMGTHFIAAEESMAKQAYKQMLVDSTASDIITTDAFTGIPNNMLRPSIKAAGIDPDNIDPSERSTINFSDPHGGAKAWRDIWSAGQGVDAIKSIQTTADIVRDLEREYAQAVEQLENHRLTTGHINFLKAGDVANASQPTT